MTETTAPADERTSGPGDPEPGAGDSARARFLSAAFVGAFLLVLGSAYAVNVLGNPYEIFPFGSRGSGNERVWKARRLATLVEDGTPPGVLILGSSRMLQMNPVQVERITGEPTFNFAVRGGGLLEYDAFFRYAIALGVAPKAIILSVDEQNFLPGEANRMRLMGETRLFRAVRWRDRLAIGLSVLKKLNLRATIRSGRALMSHAPRPFSNRFVAQMPMGTLLENGYLVRKTSRHKSDGAFNLADRIDEMIQEKKKAIRFPPPPPEGDDRIPPNEWQYLLALFDAAHERGIQVYVLTPPNHPAVSDSGFGEERRRFLPELRDRLRRESALRGFIYRDFSELESFDGDENSFWDGIHQQPANMRKMTNALFGRPPDADVEDLSGDDELLVRARKKWGNAVE